MKIAIIGGGLTGLVIGYRLSNFGHQVTIYEKENNLGGLASGFRLKDIYLEKAYHHIFKTDNEIIGLIEELGLKKKLVWNESKVGLYFKEKMYPFTTAIDLMKFKPLRLIDKIRMGLVAIYLQKNNNWKKFVKIPAWQWMKKWCGDKAYKIIWEPLLRGKYHDYYKDVSMAWLWARIHVRGSSKDKDGKERLGYLIGGFQQVINELEKRIKKNRGKFILGKEVDDKLLKQIQKDNEKVILTIPSRKVVYLGAIEIIFVSKQNLSEYYWHNINDLKSPFLAFIQHTNFIDKKYYGDEHIYYLGTYIPHSHKYFKSKKEEIFKEFFDYLKVIFPLFNEELVSQKFIFKFKNAQHVVDTNYESHDFFKRNKYELTKGRLFSVNFAKIFPEDRGFNYAVKESEEAVKIIVP